MDPASGETKSWPKDELRILLVHRKYLECPANLHPQAGEVTVADGVAQWLKTGNPGALVDPGPAGKRFFQLPCRHSRGALWRAKSAFKC
jgi:hypothetical protein